MGWRDRLPKKEHHNTRKARKAANRADRQSQYMPDFRNIPDAALQLIRGR